MGRKPKTENRDAILKAAYYLFLTRGYDNVSNVEIAALAKLDPRIIYRHFQKKECILGMIIENIEREMLEYISGAFTENPIVNYSIFFIMKFTFSLNNADYFRLDSSLIRLPDASIRKTINIFELIYPSDRDWRYDKSTRIKWFYMIGGQQMLQYEFITNYSGYSLSTTNSDFMSNYAKKSLSIQASIDFTDYMDYALKQEIKACNASTDEEAEKIVSIAKQRLSALDINGFRGYYEDALGF